MLFVSNFVISGLHMLSALSSAPAVENTSVMCTSS